MNPLLFTDPLFLFLFAPLVLAAYYVMPAKARNPALFVASVLFYAWGEGPYTLVLFSSLAVNYGYGLALGRSETNQGWRAGWFWTGIILNLALLGFFKYSGFAIANLNFVLQRLHVSPVHAMALHLPVGISFYTFMGISYLADIYRKQMRPQRSLTMVGLYITMFPHLIAGPIVRFSDIAGELLSRHVGMDDVAVGIRRFVIGLGKKMLIANTVAGTADKIFAIPTAQLPASVAWLGIICYTLQIYYDFSGYSDMAIGLARMLGFTFPENFNYPYIARSITEFWTRWHISLSTWLRDYLFFPLGIRGGKLMLYRNLLIVFFLCGLWHGADWRFVIWGLYHGVFLVLERMNLTRRLGPLPAPVRHAYALLVIMVGWVFFRADTLRYGMGFLSAMAGLTQDPSPQWVVRMFLTPDLMLALGVGILGCAPLLPFVNRQLDRSLGALPGRAELVLGSVVGTVRVAAIGAVFVAAAALSAAGTYNPFIYFRF